MVTQVDGDGVAEDGGALKTTGGDIDPLLPEDERERRITGEKRAKWAININVIANILLLAAKIFAAFASSSLSLIASLVDSALDLLCTLIIWTTNKLVQWKIRRLRHKFPVGRRRLEPLGILVFSIIMIVSFLQILKESVTKLLPGGPREAAILPPVAIGALVATVVVKGTIWIGCIRVKTTQVQALAQGIHILPLLFLPLPAPLRIIYASLTQKQQIAKRTSSSILSPFSFPLSAINSIYGGSILSGQRYCHYSSSTTGQTHVFRMWPA